MKHVYFLFINTEPDTSLEVTQEVAKLSPIRWAAQLEPPEFDVIAPAVLEGPHLFVDLQLNVLLEYCSEIPGVNKVISQEVPGAVYFSVEPEPHPVNGWP